MHYIYLVRNELTKEPYYVGQTTGLENRAATHYANTSFENPEVICLYQTENKQLANTLEFHYTLLYETYKPKNNRTFNVMIGTFNRKQLFDDNVKQFTAVPNTLFQKYQLANENYHNSAKRYKKLYREYIKLKSEYKKLQNKYNKLNNTRI